MVRASDRIFSRRRSIFFSADSATPICVSLLTWSASIELWFLFFSCINAPPALIDHFFVLSLKQASLSTANLRNPAEKMTSFSAIFVLQFIRGRFNERHFLF